MNNELLQNLDKLHTIPMGVDRIRRNLVFGEGIPDVIAWCKNQVQNPLMYRGIKPLIKYLSENL